MTTRVYRGLSRREHNGWILGLTVPQVCLVVVLAAPVVWAISASRWADAAAFGTVCGLLMMLVVVPLRGRPAARWLGHWALYQLGVLTGWSRWQSRAAAGVAVTENEPDLPGELTRITMPDGPPFRGGHRVCLLHDTVEARWGAIAQLSHSGVGLSSDEVKEMLARRLGSMLRSVGQHGILDRVSVYVRSVPDDGTRYAVYRARNQVAEAPRLSVEITDELDRSVGSVSVAHEVFITVSASEDALRKPAQHAGGGIAGRAAVLHRALDGLEEPLRGLGATSVHWLDSAGAAEAIRTAFNPGAAGVLVGARLAAGSEADRGLPLAAAGPAHAPAPDVRSYTHDGYTTVSYAVVMPNSGTRFAALAPLLAIRSAGERRTLAVHYEMLPHSAAAKDVRSQRYAAGLVSDLKASRGFRRSAADTRYASTAGAQEQAVDAGHGLVRFAVAASITVPATESIEDRCARMETDIAGRFRLLRLELAQDSGFVATCVPVGVGLPRARRGLL